MILLVLVTLCFPHGSGAAAFSIPRTSTTPNSRSHRATATANVPVEEDFWKTALGPSGKRQRRRQKHTKSMDRSSDATTARKSRSSNPSPDDMTSTESLLLEDAILSVDLLPPLVEEDGVFRALVQLHNGTQVTVDPSMLHQRTDQAVWLALRRTLNVTASEFSAVLNTSFFSNRDKLLQIKLGRASPTPLNAEACAWGLRMEPKALQAYIQETGNTVQQTGLHVTAVVVPVVATTPDDTSTTTTKMFLGASPDGLVIDHKDGTLGLLEIKSLWGRRNKQKELPQFSHCPNRFYAQIQGQLAICNREWCDLILYVPPKNAKKRQRHYSIVRVARNQLYWETVLLPSLSDFVTEMAAAQLASNSKV
jgi:putative phage-type endonuclease